jgi:hypothetical protein
VAEGGGLLKRCMSSRLSPTELSGPVLSGFSANVILSSPVPSRPVAVSSVAISVATFCDQGTSDTVLMAAADRALLAG